MNEPKASSLHQQLLVWSAIIARRSLEDFHRFAQDAGLTMLQMHVLVYLYSHGPCEMNSLVHTTRTSKAAISQLVERLVQQELVQRNESPEDRRARHVSLTMQGQRLVARSTRARQAWLRRITKHLSIQQQTEVAHALSLLISASAELDNHTATKHPSPQEE
jgi:DNA-binding MarR family transcriptional regulator